MVGNSGCGILFPIQIIGKTKGLKYHWLKVLCGLTLRYIKAHNHDQETIEFTRGTEKIDTGNLDLTRGTGEYTSSEAEFLQMAALAVNLFGNISSEVGPEAQQAAELLATAASRVRQNGSVLERAMRQ